MRKTQWIALAALNLMLLGFALSRPRPPSFQNLEEAAARVRAAGFHVTSDRADGVIHLGFFVTPFAVEPREISGLRKAGVMGPEWKNKVWVTRFWHLSTLETLPDDAVPCTWGNVFAFGDSELLAELESKLRGTSASRTEREHHSEGAPTVFTSL